MALKFYLTLILLAGTALAKYNKVVPTLDEDAWWGPGTRKEVSAELTPFSFQWSDEFLADLKWRLENHVPFRQPLEGVAFQDGMNVNILEDILQHWTEKYDFESRLKFLNQYDQYTTYIDGLNMHFVWVKPKAPKNVRVIPLLLLHGWPSTYRDFLDAVPLLINPQEGYDFVFELVIPSLPGFGFSDPPARPGLGPAGMAVLMHKLMMRLGYNKYYVQAGDLATFIGNALATLYPDQILGYHTNFPYAYGTLYTAKLQANQYRPEVLEENVRKMVYPLEAAAALNDQETGYSHIQRTKPATIGVPLTDSPAGLAAYILEKYSSGTDIEYVTKADGGFSLLNIDNMIDNIMIYWTSNSMATSVRTYKELVGSSIKERAYRIDDIPTSVPFWALQFYKEFIVKPAVFMVDKYVNLLNVTYLGAGGHFLALTGPEILVEDVYKSVKAFQAFHATCGNVCNGYKVEL